MCVCVCVCICIYSNVFCLSADLSDDDLEDMAIKWLSVKGNDGVQSKRLRKM